MSKLFIIGTALRHCSVPVAEYWGGLSFASSPAIHTSRHSAEVEAHRLATSFPDKAFVVLQALISVKTPNIPTLVVEKHE